MKRSRLLILSLLTLFTMGGMAQDIKTLRKAHVAVVRSSSTDIEVAVGQLMVTYPEARLQDIYKSFYQDRFGPGHLLSDTARAKRYLEKELEESELMGGPLYEATGWKHQFYRVNLAAIKHGMIDKEVFFDAFYRSTTSVPPFSTTEWQKEWQEVVRAASAYKHWLIGFEADSIRIDSMMQQQPTAVHHSIAYNQTYHPHYRIIAKDIFESELRPLLSQQRPTQQISNERISPTTLIVCYESPQAKKRLIKAIESMKAEIVYDYSMMQGMAIKKPDSLSLEETKTQLERVKGVVSVEYDQIMQLNNAIDF